MRGQSMHAHTPASHIPAHTQQSNKPTSISGSFGKISFRSSLHTSISLQRAEFVSFKSFSLLQKIR